MYPYEFTNGIQRLSISWTRRVFTLIHLQTCEFINNHACFFLGIHCNLNSGSCSACGEEETRHKTKLQLLFHG
jgi:hypothetical protein